MDAAQPADMGDVGVQIPPRALTSCGMRRPNAPGHCGDLNRPGFGGGRVLPAVAAVGGRSDGSRWFRAR
jgi:hypothetical protein